MARVFAYLMEENAEVTDKAIFRDVSKTVHEALEKTYDVNPSKSGITERSLEIAVSQLT